MEDWQQWQIRADQIAADLGQEIDALERENFAEGADPSFRAFWPRFRDLRERVRTAPAIRLEAKLDLERRLRNMGSRGYKAQEAVYARSGQRKQELLDSIQALRGATEAAGSPWELRSTRRDLDRLREQFDVGEPLVPPDRQAVWDAWSEANQSSWTRLTRLWGANEDRLRAILADGRKQIESGNSNGARRAVRAFFDALRTHECRQEAATRLKGEAEALRKEADEFDTRPAARLPTQVEAAVPATRQWRTELKRNRELMGRLSEEVAGLERDYEAADSILDQAMVRGTLVEKRRKLVELERSSRTLEQRIEQSEESPLMSAG